MSEEGSGRSGPYRLLAISGGGFLLSIGLCGSVAITPKLGFLAVIGVIVLAISVLLFLVRIIWLPFSR